MGADLIGYILVGPRDFSNVQLGKAKKYLAQVAERVTALMADESEDWDINTFKGDMKLSHIMRIFLPKDEIASTLERMAEIAECLSWPETADQANTMVDQFVDFWKNGNREVMSRDYGKNLRIWVTAGMSWGDSPTQTFDEVEQLERMGVLTVLGIK